MHKNFSLKNVHICWKISEWLGTRISFFSKTMLKCDMFVGPRPLPSFSIMTTFMEIYMGYDNVHLIHRYLPFSFDVHRFSTDCTSSRIFFYDIHVSTMGPTIIYRERRLQNWKTKGPELCAPRIETPTKQHGRNFFRQPFFLRGKLDSPLCCVAPLPPCKKTSN